MPIDRSYTAGKYALDLDGDFAAWVQSFDGGHCKAEVITEKVGTDIIQHKHIGGLSYEDISLSLGTAMSQTFYEWIQASVDHQYKRINNGALIAADYNFKETSRLNFFNALISEVGFPALDAGSKDAAKMSIKFTPEYTRAVRKQGGQVQGPLGKGEQKKWTAANFKLEIDGCPTACKWVNKIEALTIKQKVVKSQVGEQRDYQIECAHVEYPNLVLTVSESHADEFYNWHEDFVIKGNCTQDKERGGQLQFLSSDLKPLFTLTFSNLGIFSLTPEKSEAGSENIKRAKVEMYCEQVKFKAEGGAVYS
jgi:phage tail-like protein